MFLLFHFFILLWIKLFNFKNLCNFVKYSIIKESVQNPNPPAAEGNSKGEKDRLNGTLLVRVVGAVNIGNLSLGSLPYCIVEFDKNEALINAKEGGSEKLPLWQARAHL